LNGIILEAEHLGKPKARENLHIDNFLDASRSIEL